MANRRQFYGIKFPFSVNNDEGRLFDLNESHRDKVISDLTHLILTPKGTRIRRPEFGTRLIEYIFSPNDEILWESVKEEIGTAVQRYLKGVRVDKINVVKDSKEADGIFIDVQFTASSNNKEYKDRIVIKL